MYDDDDDDDYNYDIATKWYSLVSECCIIKKEQDSISLASPYLSLSNFQLEITTGYGVRATMIKG